MHEMFASTPWLVVANARVFAAQGLSSPFAYLALDRSATFGMQWVPRKSLAGSECCPRCGLE